MFVNDRLAFEVRHRIMDVRAAIARDEERGIRLRGDMLNVDVISAMLAEALQECVCLLRRLQWLDQWMLTAGEIVFLYVDQDQGCFHFLSEMSVTSRSIAEFKKKESTTPIVAFVGQTSGDVDANGF